jgi:hypothetical protein
MLPSTFSTLRFGDFGQTQVSENLGVDISTLRRALAQKVAWSVSRKFWRRIVRNLKVTMKVLVLHSDCIMMSQ